MSQYQRILLIADPALRRTPAFERAAWLAGTTGAALHIALFDRNAAIAAVSLVDVAGAEGAREAWLAHRRAWLAEQDAQLSRNGLRVTTDAVWAHPAHVEALAHIAEYRPDLVIKDVQHEPLLKRLVLQSLDWHLLRDCAAPVLLVNSLAHAVPRRIIAAVDVARPPSAADFDGQVIKAALALAIQCNAELHLAHAFDFTVDTMSGLPVDFSGQLYETLNRLYHETFTKLAQELGVPPERAHYLGGPPALALARLARSSETDVLVLGTHQRHGMDRVLLGSTAEAILDTAPCDVLVVKPGQS